MLLENPFLLNLKKSFRDKAPNLYLRVNALYSKLFEFSNEKAYLRGDIRSQSEQDKTSLLLLSCNRAATQLVENLLRKIYEFDGGGYIALNRYLFFYGKEQTIPYLDAEYMKEFMKPKGYFFGQQGPFDKHEAFTDYKKVVMCRDPRDLLVSHFYSFTQAHVPRNKHFVDKIAKAKQLGLQKYVLEDEHISYFKKCLEQAILLRDKERVFFCRYEDMMDNFSVFQEKCQEFINGEVNAELSIKLNGMYKQPELKQSTDNTRHRRSGAWGQFKTALEPDTIAKLNHEFKDLLHELDYPVE